MSKQLINEVDRQAYLKALGVQVYFPRQALAGAKASPEYDFPEVEDTIPAVEPAARPALHEVPVEALRSAPVSKNPDRPVIDLGSAAKTRAKPAVELPVFRSAEKPAAAAGIAGEDAGEGAATLRFDLGYLALTDGMAVLYELPPAASAEDKARARELLGAILRACDLQPREDSGSAYGAMGEGFSWPMPNDLGLPNTEKAGAAALSGFLRRRYDSERFDELLVFGGVVEGLVAEIGEKLGYKQTLVASLSAMLSLASLKREVWADLQPMLARIAKTRAEKS